MNLLPRVHQLLLPEMDLLADVEALPGNGCGVGATVEQEPLTLAKITRS